MWQSCLRCAGAVLWSLGAAVQAGAADSRYQERGTASWYGERFQGLETASGEIFDLNQLTAAHRELPFGAHVTVINLRTGASVAVVINDRGPCIPAATSTCRGRHARPGHHRGRPRAGLDRGRPAAAGARAAHPDAPWRRLLIGGPQGGGFSRFRRLPPGRSDRCPGRSAGAGLPREPPSRADRSRSPLEHPDPARPVSRAACSMTNGMSRPALRAPRRSPATARDRAAPVRRSRATALLHHRVRGRLAGLAVTHAQYDHAGRAAEHHRGEQRREQRLDHLGQSEIDRRHDKPKPSPAAPGRRCSQARDQIVDHSGAHHRTQEQRGGSPHTAPQQTGDQDPGAERGEQAEQRSFLDSILDLRDGRLTLPAQRISGALEVGAELLDLEGLRSGLSRARHCSSL